MSSTRTYRLAVPDLISPSYFPAIAAAELGCFEQRGVPVGVELLFPVTDALDRLRAGEFDFVAGAAHALFHNAPDADGVKLLAALSRNMYWFLVVRSDLGMERPADLSRLAGLRIGAAPGPDQGLVQMLIDAAVDPDTVRIGPVPGTAGAGISFGVTAAEALSAGLIDGFWANGMGAEVAVRRSIGTVVVDARRGDGPPGCEKYTFASLLASDRVLHDSPDVARRVLQAVMDAQTRLRLNPAAATRVAQRLFPPMEAGLTADLIARDAPYYEPAIRDDDIAGVVSFAKHRGLTAAEFGSADLVWSEARPLWGTAR